jgi:hypothetical protein
MCILYLDASVSPLPLTRSIDLALAVPIDVPPEFSISNLPNVVMSGVPTKCVTSIKLLWLISVTLSVTFSVVLALLKCTLVVASVCIS